MILMVIRWTGSIVSVVALAACASGPDLFVSDLYLSSSAVVLGAPVTVRSEISNIGDRSVADEFGAPILTSVRVGLFARQNDLAALHPLSAWALSGDYSMEPEAKEWQEQTVLAPSGLKAGPYFVCADVDAEGIVDEKDEANNRRCEQLSLTVGPLTRPDLIIEQVKALGQELASAKVSIRVKNVGEAPAAEFPVMAFRRWPRRPVLLTACPLTEAQRVAGSPPACGELWSRQALPPGGAVEWIGYLTFSFGGSNMPVTPVGPSKPQDLRETVDFMADGCFGPTEKEPLPRWCRVDEIDEINNFAEKVIRVE